MSDLWPFRCVWCGFTLNNLDELKSHDPCDGVDAYHDRNPGTDGRALDPNGKRVPVSRNAQRVVLVT